MIIDILRAKKEESGLTTQQIADRCHIPTSTVSRILSGQTENPGFQTVCDIAHCLGCTLGDLDDHSVPSEHGDQDSMIELYEKIIAAKNKWITRLVLICCILVSVLVFLLVYDATHPQFGIMR